MQNFSFLFILVLLCNIVPLFAEEYCCNQRIENLKAAKKYCDQATLDKEEGIWEFADDEMIVLIKKRTGSPKRIYDLILLATPDCRVEPGDTIGNIQKGVEENKYRLSLRLNPYKDLLSSVKSCVALMNGEKNRLMIEPVKLKLSFRTMWFLPKFWRSLKIGYDDPKKKLLCGLVKHYPNGVTEYPIYF